MDYKSDQHSREALQSEDMTQIEYDQGWTRELDQICHVFIDSIDLSRVSPSVDRLLFIMKNVKDFSFYDGLDDLYDSIWNIMDIHATDVIERCVSFLVQTQKHIGKSEIAKIRYHFGLPNMSEEEIHLLGPLLCHYIELSHEKEAFDLISLLDKLVEVSEQAYFVKACNLLLDKSYSLGYALVNRDYVQLVVEILENSETLPSVDAIYFLCKALRYHRHFPYKFQNLTSESIFRVCQYSMDKEYMNAIMRLITAYCQNTPQISKRSFDFFMSMLQSDMDQAFLSTQIDVLTAVATVFCHNFELLSSEVDLTMIIDLLGRSFEYEVENLSILASIVLRKIYQAFPERQVHVLDVLSMYSDVLTENERKILNFETY